MAPPGPEPSARQRDLVAVALMRATLTRRIRRACARRAQRQQSGGRRRRVGRRHVRVQLLVGRSTLLNIGAGITRVSLTSPNVADAMVTTPQPTADPRQGAGTISMFVWDGPAASSATRSSSSATSGSCSDQVKQLFPGEPIAVHSNGKDVVISGVVASKYVIEKAAEVAAGYVEKKEDVVNLLRQQEGVARTRCCCACGSPK